MAEAYRVGVSLNMTSNVQTTLARIIRDLENLDRAAKRTQGTFRTLEREIDRLQRSNQTLSSLTRTLRGLSSARIGGSLVQDLDRAARATREMVASGNTLHRVLQSNAQAASQMARAMHQAQGTTAATAAAGGAGRAGRRGGAAAAAGAAADAAANTHFGGHDWHRTGMGAGIVAAASGQMVKSSMERAFEVEHLRQQILTDRRLGQQDMSGKFNPNAPYDPALAKRRADAAVDVAYQATKTAPGTMLNENLKSLIDLKTITGSFEEAKHLLPAFAQMTGVLQVMDKRQGAEGHGGDQAFAAGKAMEIMGAMVEERIDPTTGKINREINPELLMERLNKMTRVAVATNMRVDPQQYLGFAKQSRVAGMMLGDEFIYEKLPALMAVLGGQRTGTALMSMFQVFQGNTMTNKNYKQLADLGLADPMTTRSVIDPKTGRMKKEEVKGRVFDADLMSRDPTEWVLRAEERMAARGIKDPREQIMKLFPAAQRSTIQGFIADMMKDMPAIQKEQQNIQATTPDVFKHFADNDPTAKLQQLTAAWDRFLASLGGPAIEPAIAALNTLTAGLTSFSDWARANPDSAKLALEVAVGLTGIGTALAGLSTAIYLFGPAVSALRAVLGMGAAGAGAAAAEAGVAAAGVGAGGAGLEAGALAAAAGGSLAGPLAAAGAGLLVAGGVAGYNEVPMVDEYGRVIGNWGGKNESGNPAAIPGLSAGNIGAAAASSGPLASPFKADVLDIRPPGTMNQILGYESSPESIRNAPVNTGLTGEEADRMGDRIGDRVAAKLNGMSVNLGPQAVGQVVTNYQSRESLRPPTGPSQPDVRLYPTFPVAR